MKEIVVISGKGGCGKTSVTAGLAYVGSPDIVIGDADVDAADMHLLMAPENTNAEDFYSGKLAVVEQKQCVLCRKCISHCYFDAIAINDGRLEINPLDCEGCGLCTHICPTNALRMETQKAGVLYVSTSRTGAPMVHAKLDIGADNSGKLVTKVRNTSRAIAEQKGKSIILTDGPPGIGCPVIAALSGASLVLIVTEPTTAGYHDMLRVHDLVKKMNVQMALVLNKAGLNADFEQKIHEFAKNHDIIDLGELPYDPIFSKSISEGLTIPEMDNEDLKQRFNSIWKDLMALSQ
ncbi:MAG: ATP-binding protein [Bacteroidales bacterium]|jgi:MinD superfamily P-loop ATPase|nr:ATP-binding protein [Bacteroidales bacterium]